MNVLAISAHPDDETLGCGGTLLKHREAGDDIYWLIATQAYQPRWSSELVDLKAQEVSKVASEYGIKRKFELGFQATSLDNVMQDQLMVKIREVISEVAPESVYLVHGGDIHSDHQSVFSATTSVLKPFNMSKLGVRRVVSYECLSSTEGSPPFLASAFVPNIFNDITPYIDYKVRIMETYSTEIHSGAMPRTSSAIRALARFRGATVGVEYAEAFMLIRALE